MSTTPDANGSANIISDAPQQAAAIGGEETVQAAIAGPRAPRARRGKTVPVGAVRTVNYYQLTKHELDYLAEPLKEASLARSVASFSMGLFITTVSSFSFSAASSDLIKGIWIAVGAMSALVSFVCFLRSFHLQKRGSTRMKEIEDQHDFS